jgi:predicted nuclease of predicted toxin-antitoxin system
MRFFLDVNLAPSIAQWLRSNGHDAVHAIEGGVERRADAELLAMATADDRVLLTRDLDFAEIAARAADGQSRIAIFRTSSARPVRLIPRLRSIIAVIEDQPPSAGFVLVVTDVGHRLRILPINR